MDKRERKKIRFTVDGVDYTLMYTVESIRKMEREGFDFTKMDAMVINVPYDLFAGAFIAKHNYVPRDKRDELYEQLAADNEQGESLVAALAEMLKDELEFITKKPGGNVTWAMV